MKLLFRRFSLSLLLLAPLALCRGQSFTRIQNGPVVSAGGETISVAWGDYDGDGNVDLALANLSPSNFLFRNTGNGEFLRVEAPGPFAATSNAIAWGDFDNDGKLDLFLGNNFGDQLFHNEGGSFVEVSSFPSVNSLHYSMSATWVDYDNDGLLDIFVATGGGGNDANDILYHNDGNGKFSLVTLGPLVNTPGYSMGSSFCDYDNDGLLDVIVPNLYGTSFLFHNDGPRGFTRVETGPVATDSGPSDGSAWADYDNDGDFDLFLSRGGGESNFLYRNEGNGTFTKIQKGAVVSDGGFSVGAAWGDYDNDGFIDLAVANRLGPTFLYHNNGDGTFTRVADGEIATSRTDANSISWVDYDGDGFLDLFVGNWAGEGGPNTDLLFHNNGNANSWLKVKLVGTASNRFGVGAKVRVIATIKGQVRTLLRQIGGFDSLGATTLDAHFGLGDAAEVTAVEVEWPSGIKQRVNTPGVKRTITLVEPTVTQVPAPRFDPPAGFFTNGVNVVITTDSLATIRYTLDNTAPTAASAIYNSPLRIRAATTVQARAFVGQQAVSDITMASFTRIYAFEGDGIPRAWREQYFGADFQATDPRVDASADPDGDGATNLQEYVAKTNPLDAISVLRLRVRAVPQISWDSVPQMHYQLRRYHSQEPEISVKVGDPVIATSPVTTVVDESAPDTFGIYALEVVPSP